ncbi:MAG: hypothetical protein LBR16_04580 [Treponema sp.]|jgi:hypothetical protein|nr:hypothetical protein [Treponema sp.]
MRDYFAAVTLGAFTWKDEARLARLFALLQAMKARFLALHFFALSLGLAFPLMLPLTRLSPRDYMSRAGLSEEAARDSGFTALVEAGGFPSLIMRTMGVFFVFILIIQLMCYGTAAFFLKVSRMQYAPFSLRERLGLLLFTSTLPCILCVGIGFFIPTLHIIVFYLIIIAWSFQRSKLCRNG